MHVSWCIQMRGRGACFIMHSDEGVHVSLCIQMRGRGACFMMHSNEGEGCMFQDAFK